MKVWSSLALVALVGCASAANEPAPRETHVHSGSGLVFPDELGGIPRGQVRGYRGSEAGASAVYARPEAPFSIFLTVSKAESSDAGAELRRLLRDERPVSTYQHSIERLSPESSPCGEEGRRVLFVGSTRGVSSSFDDVRLYPCGDWVVTAWVLGVSGDPKDALPPTVEEVFDELRLADPLE